MVNASNSSSSPRLGAARSGPAALVTEQLRQARNTAEPSASSDSNALPASFPGFERDRCDFGRPDAAAPGRFATGPSDARIAYVAARTVLPALAQTSTAQRLLRPAWPATAVNVAAAGVTVAGMVLLCPGIEQKNAGYQVTLAGLGIMLAGMQLWNFHTASQALPGPHDEAPDLEAGEGSVTGSLPSWAVG